MTKKTVEHKLYGKMVFNEDCWTVKNKETITIGNMVQSVPLEIDIVYVKYEKFKLGLLMDELQQYYSEHQELLKAEKALSIECKQEDLYKNLIKNGKQKLSYEIEEAALRKREEILEGETEESFAKIVGKEKAQKCFEAKTREEKLSSIKLQKMRIFKDCIEITCTCDWFNPSGGFTIFADGSAEMLYVDSMSIQNLKCYLTIKMLKVTASDLCICGRV